MAKAGGGDHNARLPCLGRGGTAAKPGPMTTGAFPVALSSSPKLCICKPHLELPWRADVAFDVVADNGPDVGDRLARDNGVQAIRRRSARRVSCICLDLAHSHGLDGENPL